MRVIMEFSDLGFYGYDHTASGEQRAWHKCGEYDSDGRRRSTKPASLNLNNGTYYCHVCKVGGNINKSEKQRYNFNPVIPEGTTISEREQLIRYFKSRNISEKTLQDNRVGFIKSGNQKWIAFNYYFGDDIVNQKLRTSDKKFKQTKGGTQIYYNINNAINKDEIIITEGEIDVLSFYEAGFDNAISVPGGGMNPGENKKLEFIENTYDLITAEKIILGTDDDTKGRGLRDELAKRYGLHKCYIIDFPEGCKDANDVLVNFGEKGKEKLQELVNTAEPYPVKELIPASNLDIRSMLLAEPPPPLRTNIRDIDRLINNLSGALVVVTGIPQHGKTTFVEMLTIQYALNEGHRYLIYSGEHTRRDTTKKLGRAFLMEDPIISERIEEAEQFISDHYYFLDLKESYTVDDILNAVEYSVKKYAIDGFVIDNWTTIQYNPGSLSETGYIGRVLFKIQSFCRRHNVTCYLIAHPRKKESKAEGYQMPRLYDVANSANFNNLTDVGIIVHRDKTPDGQEITKIVIEKSRSEDYAKTGIAELQYNVYGKTLVEKDTQQIPEYHKPNF